MGNYRLACPCFAFLSVCLAYSSGFLISADIAGFHVGFDIGEHAPKTTTYATSTTAMPATGHVLSSNTSSIAPHTPTHASGLICYSCKTEAENDDACTSVTRCNLGEICTVFHDDNGYTHRCLDSTVCSNAKALVQPDCWECCSHSLCNRKCSTVACEDTDLCALLMSTGYNVCSDAKAAAKECKRTCDLC